METDSELIEQYKDGDDAAFGLLVDRYTDRLFSFVKRLAGESDIAEDAVQDAFVKIWKNLGKFDSTKSFKSWAFAIARNAAIDILRKRKDNPFSSLAQDEDDISFEEKIPDVTDLQDKKFDSALTQKVLEKAIEKLTFDQRTAVILHDTERLSFEEIAAITKKPANTVKSHYRRAILSLRNILSGKDL